MNEYKILHEYNIIICYIHKVNTLLTLWMNINSEYVNDLTQGVTFIWTWYVSYTGHTCSYVDTVLW